MYYYIELISSSGLVMVQVPYFGKLCTEYKYSLVKSLDQVSSNHARTNSILSNSTKFHPDLGRRLADRNIVCNNM